MELDFEWDARKAESNLEKHGISFATATAVFDDTNHIEEDTTRPEQGETRTKAVGTVKGELIVAVVYTDREQKRRIISARRAGKNERDKYYQSQTAS
jgi:Uncharacterized protein conserved in bacteria